MPVSETTGFTLPWPAKEAAWKAVMGATASSHPDEVAESDLVILCRINAVNLLENKVIDRLSYLEGFFCKHRRIPNRDILQVSFLLPHRTALLSFETV